MKLKSTSFKLTEKRMANLKVIADSFGCRYNDAPSIGEMLNQIADGNLEIRRAMYEYIKGFPPPENKVPPAQQPTAVPIQPPAWNTPMCQKSEFVTERGDGTFVDTEEFDKPVPQKRVPAVLPASGNVQVPLVSGNVEAMKNATKEQKIQAALAAMGSAIKKGSEL